jgi:uncharacterized membrane protein YfcA
MSFPAFLFLLAAVLATSTVSGVFGMAGGLLLMGALALVLPVPAAMVTHGVVQAGANLWRAGLHRGHIRWPILLAFGAGALAAAALLGGLAYAPSKPLVLALLGAVAFLAWLPRSVQALNAERPLDAALCGFSVTGLNVLAGVAGPLLDVFFVRTALTRHEIVATKAATQILSHLVKIAFYAAPLAAGGTVAGLPPAWAFAAAIVAALAGTLLGARVLDRLTDKSFLSWTRWIVTLTGVVYLVWAAVLWSRPS